MRGVEVPPGAEGIQGASGWLIALFLPAGREGCSRFRVDKDLANLLDELHVRFTLSQGMSFIAVNGTLGN